MWRLLVVPDLSGVDTLPPCSSRPGDAEEHRRRRGQIAAPRWRENRRDTESIAAGDAARHDECRGGGRGPEGRGALRTVRALGYCSASDATDRTRRRPKSSRRTSLSHHTYRTGSG